MIALSVFNKTVGEIISTACKKYPKERKIYNMIERCRYNEHDIILVEINPNVDDIMQYIPFER